jgi:hypothetical protein
MSLVDSSAWVECLANGPNASFFSVPFQDTERPVEPSVTIDEVFKASCPATPHAPTAGA